MIVFHCDLDNTLIYSYKKDIGTEKIMVELYEGREISFMTKKSHDLLKQVVEKVEFVPTTTRNQEQYQRIDLGLSVPKFALVANGGVLLVDGVVDESWYQESLGFLSPYLEVMKKGEALLRRDSEVYLQVRWVDGLFLYGKSHKPEVTRKMLEDSLNMSGLEVHLNGDKVYLLPEIMSKGMNVKRFCEKYSVAKSYVAGDSLFDCTMLACGDVSFAPFELKEYGENWNISPQNTLFSEDFLEKMLPMLE